VLTKKKDCQIKAKQLIKDKMVICHKINKTNQFFLPFICCRLGRSKIEKGRKEKAREKVREKHKKKI
jgi:hypothetical protein